MIKTDWNNLEKILITKLDDNTERFKEAFDKQQYEKCSYIKTKRQQILETYRHAAYTYKDWHDYNIEIFNILGYKPEVRYDR